MKNFSEFSRDELKKLNKSSLIMIISSLQDQVEHISRQLNLLTEQIALMNQRSFGRKGYCSEALVFIITLGHPFSANATAIGIPI